MATENGRGRGGGQRGLAAVARVVGSTPFLVAAALLAITVTAFATYPPLRQAGFAPAASAPFFVYTGDVVNVNTATAAELGALPGIGEKTAQAIVQYREAHGPFLSLDDLDAVPGIGPATIEKLREYLAF